MAEQFFNWNKSAVSEPTKVARARNVTELVMIVNDEKTCPSPVRVAGHLHSMTACFATTGTQVLLEGEFTTKCELSPDQKTLTVGAGVTMLQIADFLQKRGLQLEVMPEIGNATAGSVACCGTKDSSFNTGPGQVSSTVVAVTMVKTNGAIEQVDARSDPARLRLIRSSYGLLGIIGEVTFATEPLTVARYTYQEFSLENSIPTLDQLRGKVGQQSGADAILGFMDPYHQRILIERRALLSNPEDTDSVRIAARKLIWKKIAPEIASLDSQLGIGSAPLPNPGMGLTFKKLLGGFRASRADCMLDFKSDGSFFDFTFWAFPVRKWETLVPRYLEFVREYEKKTGFRMSLFTEVYLIAKDDASFLTFSPDGDIFTLDLVHSDANDPQWREMNRRFNAFAAEQGGLPLLNQTKELTKSVVQATLGHRWQTFLATVHAEDPSERFMNDFFRGLS